MFPTIGRANAPDLGFPMRSLRFINYSGHLNYFDRTIGSAATSRTVWTFSCWIKSCTTAQQNIFTVYQDASNYSEIYVTSAGALSADNYVGAVMKSQKRTNALIVDPTAWYHICVSSNSNTSLNVYINGVQITDLGISTGPDATNWFFNGTSAAHYLGSSGAGGYSNCYLADVVWVDGQALTPTSFTNVDVTGKLIPKYRPTAGMTLGNHGFWLSFDQYDAADASKLGYNDASGARGSGVNGGAGNWTQHAVSTTAGTSNDSVVDTPIDYNDGDQGRGNYATLSLLNTTANQALIYGNTYSYGAIGTVWSSAISTLGMIGGKWYCEIAVASGVGTSMFGLVQDTTLTYCGVNTQYVGAHATTWAYHTSGNKYTNATAVAYGNTFTTGDIISVIFDADNGKLYFAKNGTVQNSGDPVAGTGYAYSGLSSTSTYHFGVSVYDTTNAVVNFGQKPFTQTSLWATLKAGGYKSLCTKNQSAPTLIHPSQYFDVTTWTGTGAAKDITGLSFSPDFIWIKDRANASQIHTIEDSTRGTGLYLTSPTTAGDASSSTNVTALLSNGFSLGTSNDVNKLNDTYVAWCMKEGVTPGLDVVAFTAPASGGFTVAHNLGAKPDFVIAKVRSTTGSWCCTLPNVLATSETIILNTTAAISTTANSWLNTDASNVGMLVGTNAIANATHIAYVFKNIPGFSKFGLFTSNNIANGPYVHLGFKPKFLMMKYLDAAASWFIADTTRGLNNPVQYLIKADLNTAESTTTIAYALSNGFKMTTTNLATTGRIAYVAFASAPSKYTGAF